MAGSSASSSTTMFIVIAGLGSVPWRCRIARGPRWCTNAAADSIRIKVAIAIFRGLRPRCKSLDAGLFYPAGVEARGAREGLDRERHALLRRARQLLDRHERVKEAAAIHRGHPSPPLPSELKLLEKVDQAIAAPPPKKTVKKKATKKSASSTTLHDADADDMSNLTARREYNKTLEGKVKELNDQKGAAVVSAKSAEDRFRVLLQQKEEMAEERGRLTETLAVERVERKSEHDLAAQAQRVLEVRVKALEAELADEKSKHAPRIAAFEEEVQVLRRERDTLTDDRARLQQQLSSVEAQNKGLDELTKRLEAQVPPLREEKAQVVASLEAAEAKIVEVQAMREALLEEKARLVEELAVVRAEKRGAEELAKREHSELEGKLQAAKKDAAPVEERCEQLAKAKDELTAEKAKLSEQLAVLQAEKRRVEEVSRRAEAQLSAALEDKGEATQRAELAEERAREASAAKELAVSERAKAEESLAVAQSERKRVEEASRMGESKYQDELAAVQAHASFAEQRCAEVSKQRDAANDERAKASEALAVSISSQRTAEEALAVLGAEKRGVEELASKVEGGLRDELSNAAERMKPVEARVHELHRMCEALQEERHRSARELQQAVASGRALHEQLHTVLSEKRQLEQQLLYVHALTRPPGSAQMPQFFAPSVGAAGAGASGVGGGMMPFGVAGVQPPPQLRPYEAVTSEPPPPYRMGSGGSSASAAALGMGSSDTPPPFLDPVLSVGGGGSGSHHLQHHHTPSGIHKPPSSSSGMGLDSPIHLSSSSSPTANSVLSGSGSIMQE